MPRFSIIPRSDPRQAVRVKRYFLAVVASLLVLAFLAFSHAGGYMEATGFFWCTAGIFTLFVVFYALIRSGLNLKFRDPSLTGAQMVSAFVVIHIGAFYTTSEARGNLLPILLMIFYFGIYRLDTRAMMQLSVINLAFYGAMIGALHLFRPQTLDLALELMRMGILAVVSMWFGMVGGHVTKLRRELATRKDAIEALLERDDLTGAGNRRFLTHMLEQEKSRAGRSGSVFCVAMLDLDYFKRVNDTYGHMAGDKVLKVFAHIAQQELRKIDYFGRYGGEEFMLIMSDTRIDGARVKAERLRHILESTRFADIDRALTQTVSIGIAEYRDGETINQIQLRADKAMYKAKSKGRNRIEIDTGDAFDATIENIPPRVA